MKKEIENNIKSLDENSPFTNIIQQLYGCSPGDFKINVGQFFGLKNIFEQISSYTQNLHSNLSKHFPFDQLEPTMAQQSQKRKNTDTQNKGRKRIATQLNLDEDHESFLKMKIQKILEIADKGFRPDDIQLELLEDKCTQSKHYYNFKCSFCNILCAVYVKGVNQKFETHVWNLTRHIIRHHKKEGKSLQDYMVRK